MSDNLFNYTFNINTESSQSEVLDSLNKGRHFSPAPESFFFADLNNFPSQDIGDGFGPVNGFETSKFRITSKFNITTSKKAFATTNGRLFFAPHGNSNDKVNVFLKPSTPINVGVNIKYFVYRGIKIDSLFETYADGIKVIQRDDPKATIFLKRIWEEYLKQNSINYSNSTVFKAEELGYSTDSSLFGEITEKFFKNNIFNLPLIKQGEEFGSFEDTIGFEIVVDFGDYEQEKHESGFELDFSYVNAIECILNLQGNNPLFVAGNKQTSISPKLFKENIYHFIDPAAFYGAHISHEGAMPHGKIFSNVIFDVDKSSRYQSSVYNRFVNKFSTANNIYLYILAKRGRSYNFYNETPLTAYTGAIIPAPNVTFPSETPPNYPPPEDYQTCEWPIKIINNSNGSNFYNPNYISSLIRKNSDGSDSPHKSKKVVHFFLDYFQTSIQGNLSSFFLINSLNIKRFYRVDAFEEDPNKLRIVLESPLSFYDNAIQISNFIYAAYNRSVDYQHYYNNLIGPIDVTGIFEQEDFSSAEGTRLQWLTYKKPKIYHIANSDLIAEMKVIFEGEGDDTNLSTDSRTRLYIIYPIDSNDPNYIKRTPFTSGCDIVTKKNSFTSLVYDNKLNKQKSDIRIWKGSVKDDDQLINVLAVRNLIYDSDNISNFIQLGLTEIEYNRLAIDAPDELRFNVFFHLTEVDIDSIDNYQKYQLGITYDDSEGNLVTYTNTSEPVFVYSIDGKFFSTNNYASQFEHAETFGNVAVEFLPYSVSNQDNIWDGEYGFDWMRKTTQGIGNLRFPPFSNIMGTIPTQTDGNDPATGTFVLDKIMYNNLKVGEYNAIPLNWRISPSDNDIEYFSSWLSISKGQERTLRLSIKIGNSIPTSLKIKFKNNVFNITSPLATVEQNVSPGINHLNFDLNQLTTNSIMTTTLILKYLDISMIISDVEQLFVVSTSINETKEKVSGILNLFTKTRNNTINEKNLKIKFVPISVPLPNIPLQYTQSVLTSPTTGSPTLIDDVKRFLRHAQINAEIAWLDQLIIHDDSSNPLTNCLDSLNRLIGNPGTTFGNSNKDQLHLFLKEKLTARENNSFNDSMIIFFINYLGGIRNDDNTTTQLGGYSSGIGSDVVIFQMGVNNRVVVSHEILHSLGVPHTFDKTDENSLYVYKGYNTENIMDYVNPSPPANPSPIQDQVLSARHSTYHWQWLIARKNVK